MRVYYFIGNILLFDVNENPVESVAKCLRPYHDEYTRSRPITEVKHRRAGIVLGWGTAWELPVS